MPVAAGKVFTATVVGKRVVSVACEKCGTQFYYELTRVGVGKGSSLYFIGQNAAAGRAGNAAQADLTKHLSEDVEMVSCPNCNWVNEDAVRAHRNRIGGNAALTVAACFAATFVAPLVVLGVLAAAFEGNTRIPEFGAALTAITCLLSPVFILARRRQLRLRVDPNQTYPRRPSLPPGTPPPLVARTDPQTGEISLEIAPQEHMVPVPVSLASDLAACQTGVVFRPGQLQFPPVCCVCLAPATRTFGLSDNSGNKEILVPVCDRCNVRLRRRFYRNWLQVAAAICIVCAVLAATIPSGDAVGRWSVGAIISFVGSLVGGSIWAAKVTRPYRCGIVDRERGIQKFAAKNPAFTKLLIDHVRKSDGGAE